MNPFFSVVIPLYNKRPHISRSVYSVLGQEFKNFELIVVDDGSTDGSVDELLNINDNRLEIISKENGGVSSARNRGIEESIGEYIAFLDADDEWSERHLANMYDLINKFPTVGMYSSAYINLVNNKKSYVIVNNKNIMYIMKNYFEHTPNNSSTTIVKREIMKSIKFKEDMYFFEDHFIWYLVALKYDFAYCSEPSVIIHKDTVNRTDKKPLKLYEQFLLLHKHIDDFLNTNKVTLNQKKIHSLNKLINYKSMTIARVLIQNRFFLEAKEIVCTTRNNYKNCLIYGYCSFIYFLLFKLKELLRKFK